MNWTKAIVTANRPSNGRSAFARLHLADTELGSKETLRRLLHLFYTVLAVIVITGSTSGLCQQSKQSNFDVSARRKEMFDHLRTIIEYRRACAISLQKTGEPNDALYREQAEEFSSQAFADAFEWARAEARFIEQSTGAEATLSASSATNEQERLLAFQKDLDSRIKNLQGQISTAANQNEREHLLNSIAFLNAVKEAAQHIGETSQSGDGVGWIADISALQHSVPELQSNARKPTPSAGTDAKNGSGVVSQIEHLAELLGTRHSIKDLTTVTENARREAERLRGPITTYALGLMKKSERSGTADEEELNSYTAQVKALSAAAVPLSQEIIALEKNRNNLASWQASVDGEYRQTLNALLSRLLVMGAVLALIFILGELWIRVIRKYVRDQKRRRQFLVVRRVVAGTLSIIVLVLGFVSNFSSLATFAGFLTAGLAVGLQTILLSMAAYFFIIGRYGIKIGDRITIASVTGEVIDVGPVRFYLLELAGSGADLLPTGRVAIFSNAVLFQAGTPLYKQLPGTSYSWRELTMTIANDADHDVVREAIVSEIQKVVEEYKPDIERQHAFVQNWLQAAIEPPKVESRLLAANDAFLLWVRFPVQIRYAPETDDKIMKGLRHLIGSKPELRAAVSSMPLLQPSVKG